MSINKIIPVNELCSNSDFKNPNNLINLGIIIDIMIKDIDYKIYKSSEEEAKDLKKEDPLVVVTRAYSSDFGLKIIKLPIRKGYFDAKITIEDQFKFASSEFLHKYLNEKGVNVNIDKLSDLFISFRNKGFINDVENIIISSELGTTREKLKNQKNYYQILGKSFFKWKNNKKNHIELIKTQQKKYEKEFNQFNTQDLVEIIDVSLTYNAEKRVFASLTQEGIIKNANKYINFFEILFPDTEENTLLKSQVCAAASFYEKNINNYNKLLLQEYPLFKEKGIIGLDNFGSTLVVEAIRKNYKDRHGLVPNVGKTIKINTFHNLREGLMQLQKEKLLAHVKGSFDITKKTNYESIINTFQCIGINYVMKLVDRRFLTQGEDLVDYFIEEARKTNAPGLLDINLKLNGDKQYTYGLMKKRWEYFKQKYLSAQMSHDHISCKRIV